jgi:FkbM family methyltransferase
MELPSDPGALDEWQTRTLPTLDYLDAVLMQRRTAIDVGAAEGMVTAWLAERFDLVHAFEPVPESFAMLDGKDWAAAAAATVIRHNAAVGDRAEMRVMDGVGHSAHITSTTGAGTMRVQMVTLDSFDIPNVDLIKIDVEGFESRVILGARRLIAEHKPLIMFERKHLYGTRYDDERPDTLLKRFGYSVVWKGSLDTVMAYQPEA